MRIWIRVLSSAAAICTSLLGAAAPATTTARLHVGLSPERLGSSTTMSFDFTLAVAGSPLPPALTLLDVRLSAGMGIDTTGLATCRPALLAHGPQGCSPDSEVGTGSVTAGSPSTQLLGAGCPFRPHLDRQDDPHPLLQHRWADPEAHHACGRRRAPGAPPQRPCRARLRAGGRRPQRPVKTDGRMAPELGRSPVQ